MSKKIKKNSTVPDFRHPTEEKGVGSTLSVPLISIGIREKMFLKYLLEIKGKKRFNVKEFSRINKIPRSSVYEFRKKFEETGFIWTDLANTGLTDRGIAYLESTNLGVSESVQNRVSEVSGGGVGKRENLSAHFRKFTLQISNRENFRIKNFERMNYKRMKENKLQNLHQIIVEFSDAKIIINPKQVQIHLFEIISDSVEEVDINSLSRALDYAELLQSVGIKTEGMMIEEGHWARVDSVLANFLYEKVDEKYFLKLKDGSNFFIDHSNGKHLEDETDSKVTRERVDNFLNQIASDNFDLNDINKIKESLGFITKLESARLMDVIEETKLKRAQIESQGISQIIQQDKIPGYLG